MPRNKYTQQYLNTLEKRNNVFRVHGVILPYNTERLYSFVDTADGCRVFYPLWSDEKHLIEVQKQKMNSFIEAQNESQLAQTYSTYIPPQYTDDSDDWNETD